MFGYDQGVFSVLFIFDDFQKSLLLMILFEEFNYFCYYDYLENNDRNDVMCMGLLNIQVVVVVIYQIGCFFGVVLILFYGEFWGCKFLIFWGSFIMIIGIIMQVVIFSYGFFVVGCIVGGVGNGMVIFSKFFFLLKI